MRKMSPTLARAMPSWLLPCFRRGPGSSMQPSSRSISRNGGSTARSLLSPRSLSWYGPRSALRRPSRSLLIWGAFGNAAFVLLWLITRITGLPVGPEPWTPESVGLIDVAASVFEVVLVVSAVLMLRRNMLPQRTIVRLDRPQLAVFMGVVAAITWIAATGGGHH